MQMNGVILKVEKAVYLGEYKLRCTFNDGATKDVDCTFLLDYPAYKSLRDTDKFQEFGVDMTVFWSNGADIAPEWLYENGTKVVA